MVEQISTVLSADTEKHQDSKPAEKSEAGERSHDSGSSADLGALPIEEFRSEIVTMVKEHLFCIITGETGSGKSTQLAQFLLDGIGKPFTEISDASVAR